MNAGTVPDERVVVVKAIQDYTCNQEGVIDYFLLLEVEYSALGEERVRQRGITPRNWQKKFLEGPMESNQQIE